MVWNSPVSIAGSYFGIIHFRSYFRCAFSLVGSDHSRLRDVLHLAIDEPATRPCHPKVVLGIGAIAVVSIGLVLLTIPRPTNDRRLNETSDTIRT